MDLTNNIVGVASSKVCALQSLIFINYLHTLFILFIQYD